MKQERESLRDRYRGCVIGQCLGDALGFPVEGYVADVCRQYVSGILRSGRAGSVGRPPYPFGQYSDDSQLARELLISYVECRGFEPSDYASRIAELFQKGAVIGEGKATAEAALRLAEGGAWHESGAAPPDAGNGSAMRAAPVGLFFAGDPEALVRASIDQGRITHRDPRCGAGSVAIAGAVSLALEGGEIDPAGFLGRLAGWTAAVDPVMTEALGDLAEWLALPPAEAALLVGRAGRREPFPEKRDGISPYVVGSVLWSLYSFLSSPDDYWETIVMAVAVGGDVDTTAAMAGAVSGARNGLEALPPLLARVLNDQGSWGYDELVSLADACFDLAAAGRGG